MRLPLDTSPVQESFPSVEKVLVFLVRILLRPQIIQRWSRSGPSGPGYFDANSGDPKCSGAAFFLRVLQNDDFLHSLPCISHLVVKEIAFQQSKEIDFFRLGLRRHTARWCWRLIALVESWSRSGAWSLGGSCPRSTSFSGKDR